jgi:hypothetical protein
MHDLMDFKAYLDRTYPITNHKNAEYLTPEAVREVRYRLGKGQSVKIIAIDMDITQDQVYKIRRGETYKEIE